MMEDHEQRFNSEHAYRLVKPKRMKPKVQKRENEQSSQYLLQNKKIDPQQDTDQTQRRYNLSQERIQHSKTPLPASENSLEFFLGKKIPKYRIGSKDCRRYNSIINPYSSCGTSIEYERSSSKLSSASVENTRNSQNHTELPKLSASKEIEPKNGLRNKYSIIESNLRTQTKSPIDTSSYRVQNKIQALKLLTFDKEIIEIKSGDKKFKQIISETQSNEKSNENNQQQQAQQCNFEIQDHSKGEFLIPQNPAVNQNQCSGDPDLSNNISISLGLMNQCHSSLSENRNNENVISNRIIKEESRRTSIVANFSKFVYLLKTKYKLEDTVEIKARLLKSYKEQAVDEEVCWWQEVIQQSARSYSIDQFVLKWKIQFQDQENDIHFNAKKGVMIFTTTLGESGQECTLNLKINDYSLGSQWQLNRIIGSNKEQNISFATPSQDTIIYGKNISTGLPCCIKFDQCNTYESFIKQIKSICLSQMLENNQQLISTQNPTVLFTERGWIVKEVETYIICNRQILNEVMILQMIGDILKILSNYHTHSIVLNQNSFKSIILLQNTGKFSFQNLLYCSFVETYNSDDQYPTEGVQNIFLNDLVFLGQAADTLLKQIGCQSRIEVSSSMKNLTEIIIELIDQKHIKQQQIKPTQASSFLLTTYFSQFVDPVPSIYSELFKFYNKSNPVEGYKKKSKNSGKRQKSLSKEKTYSSKRNLSIQEQRNFPSQKETVQESKPRLKQIELNRESKRMIPINNVKIPKIRRAPHTINNANSHFLKLQEGQTEQESEVIQNQQNRNENNKLTLDIITISNENTNPIQSSTTVATVQYSTQHDTLNYNKLNKDINKLKILSELYLICHSKLLFFSNQSKLLLLYRHYSTVDSSEFFQFSLSLFEKALKYEKEEILYSLLDLYKSVNLEEQLQQLPDSFTRTALLLILLNSFEALSQNNLQQAIITFRSALHIKNLPLKDIFQIHTDLGILFLSVKKSLALHHFIFAQQAAKEIFPSSIELALPFLLGGKKLSFNTLFTIYQLGKMSKDVKQLKECLQIKKIHGESQTSMLKLLFLIGSIQFKNDVFSESAELFEQYLSLWESIKNRLKDFPSFENKSFLSSFLNQVFQAKLHIWFSYLGQNPEHHCIKELNNFCSKEMVNPYHFDSSKKATLILLEIADVLLKLKVPKEGILPLYAQCSCIATQQQDSQVLALMASKMSACYSLLYN